MLDKASLRLFTASRIMEIEFAMKPTNALNPARITFAAILIMLVLITIDSRFLSMNVLYHSPECKNKHERMEIGFRQRAVVCYNGVN